MDKNVDHCPACRRPFTGILDYPIVRVLSVERLPVPEAVDYHSAAAVEKGLKRRRVEADVPKWMSEGINRTPEIAAMLTRPEIEKYLADLAAISGQEVDPHQLLPPLKPSGYFKWAYPIGDTCLYLSLNEHEIGSAGDRTAQVLVHCDGPNMGSAGGPTLRVLGAIALVHYQGLLVNQP